MSEINEDYVEFFKNRNKNYYKYQNVVLEVDNWSINILREHLTLPYEAIFTGYSKNNIKDIVSLLYDKGMEFEIKTTESNDITIKFYEKKNTIDAVKIPNIINFYGRTNNVNPYTIMNIKGKRFLIEVTKDYAKQNKGDYYFLASDLNKQERTFFSPCYEKLEYDFLYRLDDNKNYKNEKKKVKEIK